MPSKGLVSSGRSAVFDPSINPTFTTGLWKTCPLMEYLFDPSVGVLLDEPFVGYDASTGGEYTLTQATAGSAAISTTIPGCLSIDSGSTTVTQGANVQRLKTAFVPAANKSIWFEAKVKFTGVGALNVQAFLGLAASDTTVIATSAQSTNNRMGWGSVTDDGVLLFQSDKAGTPTTAAATTIVSDTFVRYGFIYDGVADTLQQYLDGVAVGTALATTYIPKVVVYPTFVCQTGGTDQPVMHVAGYRAFQLR